MLQLKMHTWTVETD